VRAPIKLPAQGRPGGGRSRISRMGAVRRSDGAATVLDFLRAAATAHGHGIDRLTRSIGDLQDIVRRVCTRRQPQGDRAADRHRRGSRQVLPGHAWRIRRVRDQPAARAPTRRHRQGEGCWRLQGPPGFDRDLAGAGNEGARHAAGRYRHRLLAQAS
jgi:hypothetical protein